MPSGKAPEINEPLNEKEKKIVEKLSDKNNLKRDLDLYNSIDKERAFRRFAEIVKASNNRTDTTNANINVVSGGAKLRFKRYLLYGSAAIAASLIILFYIFSPEKREEITLINSFAVNPVSQVILKTEDGKQYTTSGEIKIAKSQITADEKELVSVNSDTVALEKINAVITPKGVRQKVVLSDETIVWLNSETKLSFPIDFSGDSRVVTLEGEAFFDVKKSAKPFIVNIGDKAVKVHGTTFNLSSYHAVSTSVVSLYTGSVEIITPFSSYMLAPGYHIEIDNSSNEISCPIENRSASPDWIRGRIEFYRQPLSKIFETISRWYAIDYILDSDVKDLKAIILVSDKITLDELIDLLQLTENISITYEEKTIKVTSKTKKM